MKKKTVLILHGWGVGSQAYHTLKALLEKENFLVFAPDLPGFGEEALVKEILTIDDYVVFVKKLIRNHIKGEYVIIGHSFGGRLAIILGTGFDKNLSKIILTGAAGIVHPLPFRSKVAFFLAKYASGIFTIPPFDKFSVLSRKMLYKIAGELDYYKAGKLRKTFQNVIARDLSDYLPKITAPVLLVWGENDFVIPPSDGEYMQKKIKNSKLIVVAGARHNFPYTMPHVFVEKILPFLKK